jgi:hypothetical protein
MRQATLTLPDPRGATWPPLVTLPLDDVPRGYATTQLNLGFPGVREDMNLRPDTWGAADLTRLFGARVVSANVTLVPGGSMKMDDLLGLFAPFLDPSARPVLTYQLDTAVPVQRQLTLRVGDFSAPLVWPSRLDVLLTWTAADPIARAVDAQSATVWANDPASGTGRRYPLTFPRTYSTEEGGGPESALALNAGTWPAWPTIRIWGPCTTPRYSYRNDRLSAWGGVWFVSGFRIDAGHYVDVDTQDKTVILDTTTPQAQSVYGSLDFPNTRMIPLQPGVDAGGAYQLSLAATQTSPATQATMTWRDAYLT